MSFENLPRLRVVSAEIVRNGRYLITRRRPDAVLPDLWEFPGGRVRQDEADDAALLRALRLRLGIEPVVGEKLMEVVHAYESYMLTLAVHSCVLPEDVEPVRGHIQDFAWVRPEEFGNYEFPGADQATVEALVKALE